jgi:hypothetical protein
LCIENAPENVCITQYLPELEPNKRYLLTFFVKTEKLKLVDGKSGGACVNVNPDINMWFPKHHYSGTFTWIKQGFIFKTGPETNKKRKAYMRLYLYRTLGGKVWFDDLRLRECPETIEKQ